MGRLAKGTRIYLREGACLVIGTIEDTEAHRHHALQVSVSIEGPMVLETEDGAEETQFKVIAPDRRHRLSGAGGTQALLLVDPESDRGRGIEIGGTDSKRLDDFRRAISVDPPSIDDALRALSARPPGERSEGVDPRIAAALSAIDSSAERRCSLSELARAANLSASRLQHLFKAETGISVKRYLLWKRMIGVALVLSRSGDLTRGAVDAGFFDSAHLSRSFKAMFGLNPREVFKDSASVQEFRA